MELGHWIGIVTGAVGRGLFAGQELGAIAPGYFADIVALEGDPLADIAAVTDGVRWVMTGGAVVVDRRGPQ